MTYRDNLKFHFFKCKFRFRRSTGEKNRFAEVAETKTIFEQSTKHKKLRKTTEWNFFLSLANKMFVSIDN